jgi:hypothetical protein
MFTACDSNAVELRSDEGDALARFSYEAEDEDFGLLVVELESPVLRAKHATTSLRGDGLDAFLGRLAGDWRGWEGPRSWQTLRPEVGIDAVHQGRRVELSVFISADDSEARLRIALAPGEPLNRAARDAAALFA